MTHSYSRTFRSLALMCLGLPAPALAQSLAECDDWRSSAFAIAEPWEANTRVYADAAVRLAISDVGEPAAGSFRLVILSLPTAEPVERRCVVMSLDADLGFASLTFDGATDSTDTNGLTVRLPATRWLPDTDTYAPAVLSVTVNTVTGETTAALE